MDGPPFGSCPSIKTFVVGRGVTHIPDAYFGTYYSNTPLGLRTVILPDTITSIGGNAFGGRTNLTAFTLPASVKSIGSYAFKNCRKAFDGELSLGAQVATIGSSAFEGCTGINALKIQNGLTVLSSSCFSSCTALEEVTIPKSVTRIDSYAFNNCTSLTNVWLEGVPPTTGSYVFGGVAPGARGHYPRSLASEWLPPSGPIDRNGKWNGLIMHELSQPVLRVKEANPVAGSITLAWDDGGDVPDGTTYTVYRSAAEEWTDADRVATVTGSEWTDNDYWRAEPVLSPLNYWVVAENDHFDIPESNRVETRHRYGQCVGLGSYSWYDIGLTDNLGLAYDAALCNSLAKHGGFIMGQPLLDGDATAQSLGNSLKAAAASTQPGDIFLLFLAAHGGVGKFHLYGWSDYSVSELRQDIAAFNPGVAVVGIVMTCHSGSLLNLGSWPDNAGWICSCDAAQTALLFGGGNVAPTPFGGVLLRDGWRDGYADRALFGTEWSGGDGNGYVSFEELANYAGQLYKGYSDLVSPSAVQTSNDRLLSLIVAGPAGEGTAQTRPPAPTACSASYGTLDSGIKVQWATVNDSNVTWYWLFREGPDGTNCISRYAKSGVFCDPRTIERTKLLDFTDMLLHRLKPTIFREYTYYVRSVSPCGVSADSPHAIGMSGTPELRHWFDDFGYTDEEIAGADISPASNGTITVFDSYVSGINPKDSNARFESHIDMIDGKPVVTPFPDLGTNRVYTIEAKASLSDEEWREPNENSRFFRVKVRMPE